MIQPAFDGGQTADLPRRKARSARHGTDPSIPVYCTDAVSPVGLPGTVPPAVPEDE